MPANFTKFFSSSNVHLIMLFLPEDANTCKNLEKFTKMREINEIFKKFMYVSALFSYCSCDQNDRIEKVKNNLIVDNLLT